MESAFSISLVFRNHIFREGLQRLFTENGYHVVASVDDPQQLGRGAGEANEIVVVEGILLEGDGHGVLSGIAERMGDPRIVVTGRGFSLERIAAVMAAGAYGFVDADLAFPAFRIHIDLVASGERVIPSNLIDTLFTVADRGNNDTPQFDLNDRECDVLDGLVMGLPNKAIARRIGMSEPSVKLAVKSIFRKLEVQNRTQAALLARESGWVEVRMNGNAYQPH